MLIPEWIVILTGLIASAREAHNVFWLKRYANMGTLFAFSYLTLIYLLLASPFDIPHAQPFVRIGIFLVFLDKAILFAYEIWGDRKWK